MRSGHHERQRTLARVRAGEPARDAPRPLRDIPRRDYRGGINIWIGRSANCIWVGEEHKSNWCTRVRGPEGGLPSLSDLRDVFEEAINKAADAAGIAVPAIVVTALVYYLAASTLAPPTGVPLV